MIDTSSHKKPKPASKKKPLTQIQEEEENEDQLQLELSEEEEDPLEESKRAYAKALESSASASALEEEEDTFEEQQRKERIAKHRPTTRPTTGVKGNSNFLTNFIYSSYHGRLTQEAGELQDGRESQVDFEEQEVPHPR